MPACLALLQYDDSVPTELHQQIQAAQKQLQSGEAEKRF